MRKDRISVALSKDLIKKLDEASKIARRSRSDLVQIILEMHLSQPRATETLKEEIPFKMG